MDAQAPTPEEAPAAVPAAGAAEACNMLAAGCLPGWLANERKLLASLSELGS